MLQENTDSSPIIEISTEGLTLGHWAPSASDSYLKIPDNTDSEHLEQATRNEWVEESQTALEPIVLIDLQHQVVELVFDTPMELEDVAFNVGLSQKNQVASFRFKDISGCLEVCEASTGQYSLIFSLKHPAKLYAVCSDDRRKRLTQLSCISQATFASCSSYRVLVQPEILDRILIDRKKLHELQKFGIIRRGLECLQQAIPFDTRFLSAHQRIGIDRRLASMDNFHQSLALKAVIDSHKCSPYYLLYDTVSEDTIFDLVDSREPHIAEVVCSSWRLVFTSSEFF